MGNQEKDKREHQDKEEDAIQTNDTNSENMEENPAEESSPNEGEDVKSRLDLLEEENSLLKDQLLRKQADFENFRKRLTREKEDSIKYANQMLLLDITSIIDDFERAIKSADESKDFTSFHDGVSLIEKQMISMLEKKWNLKRFDSVGEVFDPDRHLAIAVEENGECETVTVVEDYQKGYLFHERVLRPAKVKVAKPFENTDEARESDVSH